MARALENAVSIIEDSKLPKMLTERYASYDNGAGKDFEEGKITLAELVSYANSDGEPKQISGQQELYESILSMCV